LFEAVAGWTFTPPIWRGEYLIRHPGEVWIRQVCEGLRGASDRSDPEAVSVALNNLALVLFKAGMADEARLLCQAHYRRFAASANIRVARFAVQPWINEGRLLARRGNVAGARHRFLLGPRPEAVVVGERTLAPLDADTMAVCRNVAVVDGFMLELRAGGVDGAEAHLTRLERRGVSGSLMAQCRLQLALARGRAEEAALILDQLPPDHLPMLACYRAAIALVRNAVREFARDVLLLVALLDCWTETELDVANILLGLLWLGRIGGEMYRVVLGDASQDYLCGRALELDDEELQCLLAGRRYDPLPEGSSARNLAADLLREALIVLRGNQLGF
jgi:hypothetical protein